MRSTEPDQPLDVDDMPPELKAALQKMSERHGGRRVIDLATGKAVAEDGHLMVACTTPGCETAAQRPADGQWAYLWERGWRWLGTQNVVSCPDCPPVVITGTDGSHRLGPGGGLARTPAGELEG
ncbi:hypothetical protein ACH4S8_37280 [Streptomyces sp. NPDC021080]|uniref:hypothetical protein n=1 Tax=Streptomyces sp. NPDC021080 TaxID=3365110 RepID=UPI0037A933C6